ncbi:CBS domain-containing protein [Antrihabitans sp. NCIMB 15449]|uniref:CBS domain-containing protein n=1 Tax=Antrihabitans spumae TaxID=3373370 RepID=A0ABW7JXE6_9NOCA
MLVRDLMIRSVVSVRPETSLREDISILIDICFAALPVVDGDGLVVGVLSDSTALVAALARTVPGVRHVDVLPTAVAPAAGT